LEIAKQRLYDNEHPQQEGAIFTLHHSLLALIKLFAPILPHVTERIYLGIFKEAQVANHKSQVASIHTSNWPVADLNLINLEAETLGDLLIEIASAVRRYKSERNLSLGTELKRLQLATGNPEQRNALTTANADLMSITRALHIEIVDQTDSSIKNISTIADIVLGIEA